MVREIITKKLEEKHQTILIHRYNSLDDTFIQYYFVKSIGIVYKNVWYANSYTVEYKKRGAN